MSARNSICSARQPATTIVGRPRRMRSPKAAASLRRRRARPPDPRVLPCVSHLHTPDGQRKATLKVLQTSACQNNCNYCAFRAGRDIRRAHLAPDELARSFDLMYRAGLVESLFLSSGVIGTHRTMDEMLATTELVRQKYGFRGYIHLKLLPGAEDAHIEARDWVGRPRVGEPGSADRRDAGRARAAQADGCAGGAAPQGCGDHPACWVRFTRSPAPLRREQPHQQ